MRKITEYLRRVPPSEEPLSADVFIIDGEKRAYIYDVGNNDEAAEAINNIQREKIVILSHFHPDHTGNIGRIGFGGLYGGAYTCKKLKAGTLVYDDITIEDGVRLEIRRCPSPHAKGSLILTVNNEYTLLGDLCYTRDKQNGAIPNMLHLLKGLDTKYFIVSHERDGIYEKDELLKELEKYFFAAE